MQAEPWRERLSHKISLGPQFAAVIDKEGSGPHVGEIRAFFILWSA